MPAKITVEWLRDKCPKPQDCGKCLEVCPNAVFVMYATNRERYKKAEQYVIVPSFMNFCVTCNRCTEVCPKGAIRIEAK
ncbi:MAG: 4Fe-4S dicluster domain-containing protein [Promethearchaeati archaeon SRVP18_Atabeyarchaeia-1]